MDKKGVTKVTPVDKRKFYGWIKKAYSKETEMTAYECSYLLWKWGYIPFPHRQATHPRITELVRMGVLCTVGKKFDTHTKKKVTVYKLVKEEKDAV